MNDPCLGIESRALDPLGRRFRHHDLHFRKNRSQDERVELTHGAGAEDERSGRTPLRGVSQAGSIHSPKDTCRRLEKDGRLVGDFVGYRSGGARSCGLLNEDQLAEPARIEAVETETLALGLGARATQAAAATRDVVWGYDPLADSECGAGTGFLDDPDHLVTEYRSDVGSLFDLVEIGPAEPAHGHSKEELAWAGVGDGARLETHFARVAGRHD